MLVNVQDMTGLVLDYAVATARKLKFEVDVNDWNGYEIMRVHKVDGRPDERDSFNPSKSKANGFWVVKELFDMYYTQIDNGTPELPYNITVRCSRESRLDKGSVPTHYVAYTSKNLVEAASRCYVALKHGTEMEIPDVYVSHQTTSDAFRKNLLQQLRNK